MDSAMGMSTYLQELPNGSSFAQALGHPDNDSSQFTKFGTAFGAVSHTWSAEFCKATFPGASMTNGAAFGDPCCTWKKGGTPDFTVTAFTTTPGKATVCASGGGSAAAGGSTAASGASTPSAAGSAAETPSTSSGSSAETPSTSSGSSAETPSTETQSSGSSDTTESSGSSGTTESSGSSGTTESSGSSTDTQSSGSSVSQFTPSTEAPATSTGGSGGWSTPATST
uniref:Temptin Cys/Cys disulfide domain-containing protein n=1 Tax=Phytophthora ramorum TaxID=164328 RepID=H3H8J9_PHYRM